MANIKDVARQARVSVATVSRVFNHTSVVSEATRTRVLRIAARLNYWPHGAARSLITNRTHAIGVLLPDLFGEFFSEIIHGIDHTARKAGYHLLVSSSHADSGEMVAAMRVMRGRIDGLIVMAPEGDGHDVIQAAGADCPLVVIDSGPGAPGMHSLSIANHDGARSVVSHLLQLGHRRIAMVCGPPRNLDAVERREGFRQALREARVRTDPELEVPGDFSETSGYDAVAALLALTPRPSAVFAANDYMAIGVMGALSDAGLRVPQDMAVVGFDDIVMARYLNPPLTTVHVDAYRLGTRAAELIMDTSGASGENTAVHEVLPTTLVIRGSCGGQAAEPRRLGGVRGRLR
jgi:LacI family transcriptional regulator